MSLTVVTHTQHSRPDYLKQCIESVERALPSGAKHKIVYCPNYQTWGRARLDAVLSDEFVAFVDDDLVAPQAIKACLEALEATGAGIACTNEVLIDQHGAVMLRVDARKNYMGVSSHPRTLHHLCLFRSSAVDPRALDFHYQYGHGIDWLMKASAALQHGAIHVPIDGYYWRQHDGTMTKRKNSPDLPPVTQLIRGTWPNRAGLIDTYVPTWVTAQER